MNVEDELEKLGVKPVEGQNFLKSDQVIEALVEAGEVDGEDVLEIGAGTGVITERLVGRSDKLTVLETDTVLYSHLEKKFSSEDTEILNQDFLNYSIPGNISRCVSNVPFQISSQIVEKLGRNQIQSALILQDELAGKLTADKGDKNYGFSALKTQYYFIPVKLRTVPRESFHPEPGVDGAIIKLYPNKERWGVEDEKRFFKISKALFTHKRKKVRNAFVDARNMLEIEKDEAKSIRDRIPNSESRVNELGVKEFGEISEFLIGHQL